MTPYVLIILTSVHGGISAHSVEFNSHEACEAAKSVVLERAVNHKWNARSNPVAVDCLPKTLPQVPVR